jgi:eukaryotic-like serine/threonine-protein kinase
MPWRRRRRVIEEQAPPVPPRRPLIWPWLLLLLLLVAGGIAAAYFLARDDDSGDESTTVVITTTPTTVEVPRVVGFSVDDAAARLASNGLKSSIVRVASRRPRGRVLRQEPPSGTQAERGGSVVLTVSRRLGGVRVPRVTGLTEAAATARLDRLGFKVSVSRIQSSRSRGLVISQEPSPGTRVPRGSVVGINVSRGPAATTTQTTTTTPQPTTTTAPRAPPGRPIPNVVGLAQRDAVAKLHGAGFRVDSYPTASSRPRGTVLTQRPAGGTRATASSRVRIGVSLGSGERPLRTIPDVTGRPENEAKQMLVEIGFTVRSIDQPAAEDSERGVVLSQSPASGGRASAGSQLVLRVGR